MIIRDKKILVTGGACFIGSHLCERLVELGARVVVIDNLCTGTIDNLSEVIDKIEFKVGDISNYDESVAKFNNYGINPNSPDDDLVGDFLVQFPRNVENPGNVLASIKNYIYISIYFLYIYF